MSSEDSKQRTTKVTRQISMGQSAIRLVVVFVWVDTNDFNPLENPSDKDVRYDIQPVVALATRIEDVYETFEGPEEERPTGPDHAGMIAAGWEYAYEPLKGDCLVVDSNGKLSLLSEEFNDSYRNIFEIVATNWKAEDDEVRLQGVMKRMQSELLERYKRHKWIQEQRENDVKNKKRQEDGRVQIFESL